MDSASEDGQVPLLEGDAHQAEAQGGADAMPGKRSAAQEARGILELAVGILLSRASWVVIKSTDTALLGHVSSHALSASSVSDLWTMATGVFVQGGVLGIFVGQALGAGNKQMGTVWLQVSLVVQAMITVPVMVMWFLTGPVLRLFHTDPSLVDDAGYYATVLAVCLPAKTLFSQISQFLSAHSYVKPEAQVSVFAAALNLAVGLVLVLGVPFKNWDGFGFKACPWVTVGTEYSQLVVFALVFGYLQQLPQQLGWVGWLPEEVTRARVVEYLKLYVPAALSGASDFWRMAVIGVFAAGLGNDDVAVFNASYRILWITLTVVGSLAFSVRIRLARAIGAGDIEGARFTIKVGTLMTTGALLGTAALVLGFTRAFASIFSDDPEMLDLFVEARVPLSLTLLLMNLAVFLEQIPAAMGLTRVVFYVGVVGSWLGQVPGAYLGVYIADNLLGLYYGVAAGYGLLSLLLGAVILRTDFVQVVADAQRRSEA